jgi:hypothetical protein
MLRKEDDRHARTTIENERKNSEMEIKERVELIEREKREADESVRAEHDNLLRMTRMKREREF